MGGCLSAPRHVSMESADKLHLLAHMGAWRGSAADRVQTTARRVGDNFIVALFQGKGNLGCEVAQFCAEHVFEIFSKWASPSGEVSEATLLKTLKTLEEQLLQGGAVTTLAQEHSGATALLLCIDGCGRCYIARVGDDGCLLNRTVGNFNAKAPESVSLIGSIGQVQHQARRGGSHAPSPPHLSTLPPQHNSAQALGFAALKRQGLLMCTPTVVSHQLEPHHETLVLGTKNVWDYLTPAAAALRVHYYEQYVHLLETKRAALFMPATSETRVLQNNLAEHMLRYAAETCGRRQRPRPLSVEEMTWLPFTKSPSSRKYSALPLRTDVLGDLGLIVVQLRWPESNMDSRSGANTFSARRLAQLPDARRRAIERWDLIRTVVAFRRAYRRCIWHAWERLRKDLYVQKCMEARLKRKSWVYTDVPTESARIRADHGPIVSSVA